MNRRTFLRTTGRAALTAAALPVIVPRAALGADGPGANDRIAVGCIGTGPQGRGVMGNFLAQKEARVVAVCDLKTDQLEKARVQVNQAYGDQGCATCADFRELLARQDIDVVLVAPPDHWHVPVALAAARAGKDMYVEKPLGLTVAEDQLLRKAIRDHGRVFQFGTQQRSSSQFWLACQLVRNGRIGQLKQINVWAPASQPGGSTAPIDPPPGLDYEFWLGPAPRTPYTKDKCDETNKTWWFNYDYALGFVAGWGVHPLDIAFWGCDSFRRGLVEVSGTAVIPTEGACNTAVAWDVEYRCHDGVRMKYKGTPNGYDRISEINDLKPWEQRYGRNTGHGTAFEGTTGWIMVDRSGIRTSPERLVEEKFDSHDLQLIKSDNHVRNLLHCVRSRARTVCSIEEAVQADILCHLADIATRLRRTLKWDPQAEHFVSDSEANARLALRKMRPPWGLA